jgi:hypothetical protein
MKQQQQEQEHQQDEAITAGHEASILVDVSDVRLQIEITRTASAQVPQKTPFLTAV